MKQQNKRHNQKGFTLIELLVYVAISGIVIGAVNSYFFNIMKTYGLAKSQVVIANNQSLLFEKLNTDLRYAEDVDDTNCTFDDDNGVLTVTKGGDSYAYSIDNGVVVKSINAGVPVSITSNDVVVIAFYLEKISTVQGKEGVNISATIEGNSASGGSVTRTVAGDVFVRERVVSY